MKTALRLLLIPCLLTISTLHADIEDDIWGLQDIEEPKKQPGPFRLEFETDVVAGTHFNKEGYEDEKINFGNYTGTAGMAFCYFPQAREAYAAAVAYTYTNICWKQNPFFHQCDFQKATVALRLFSNRFSDWIWKGQFAINFDTKHKDYNHYMNYDLTLWGRYDYCEDMGLHLGIIVQTGMKIDRVYPIIGFDWDINDQWALNLAFPVNISLQYKYNCNWTGAAAMRFFDVRYRAGEDEPLPMALVAYRNTGFELAILYASDPSIEANIHVGTTVGGMLRISDKNNDHPQHFKMDPAAYVGGQLIWSF